MCIFHSTQARQGALTMALLLTTLASPSRALHASTPIPWTSEAALHRLPRPMRGSLTVSADGVQFRPAKAPPIQWPFIDIRNVDLTNPRRLVLVTYQNQRWSLPGDRRFTFHLATAMPPEVAAQFVRLVGKPAINAIPLPDASSFAVLPARHRTCTGGSDGMLRFRDSGIDYAAKNGKDARSWRWVDIQTIAHPEPYRLRIVGYLETFDFELKEALPEELFNRLWDLVYGRGLQIKQSEGEIHARVQ